MVAVSADDINACTVNSTRLQAARDWAHALSTATGLPAALYDERLSSAAVNRFLTAEADMTRKRRSEVVDQMAAAYMLQAALDSSIPPRPDED